jgi:nucleotide-binding universal stress UspA family protein
LDRAPVFLFLEGAHILDDGLDLVVGEALGKMDLKQKVGQLFTQSFYGSLITPDVMVLDAEQRPQTMAQVHKNIAGREMELLQTRVKNAGAENVRATLAEGDAAQVIIERARDFDLVVMGTHGRSGPSHWLIGSVAEKVVRGSAVPVLTVRTHKGR